MMRWAGDGWRLKPRLKGLPLVGHKTRLRGLQSHLPDRVSRRAEAGSGKSEEADLVAGAERRPFRRDISRQPHSPSAPSIIFYIASVWRTARQPSSLHTAAPAHLQQRIASRLVLLVLLMRFVPQLPFPRLVRLIH
jgi:hypothetical protein